MKNRHQKTVKSRGVTLTEQLITLLLFSLGATALYSSSKGVQTQMTQAVSGANTTTELQRAAELILYDIRRAGSDPSGVALFAYNQALGKDRRYFPFGVNPSPTNAQGQRLGMVQLLTYAPYDENQDGVIEIEEGLRLSAANPASYLPMKFESADNIVYDLKAPSQNADTQYLIRKNLGDSSQTLAYANEQILLTNVCSINFKYWVEDPLEGLKPMTSLSEVDQIRQVEIELTRAFGTPKTGQTQSEYAEDHFCRHRKIQKITRKESLRVHK